MYKYCMPNEYISFGRPTNVIPLMKLKEKHEITKNKLR